MSIDIKQERDITAITASYDILLKESSLLCDQIHDIQHQIAELAETNTEIDQLNTILTAILVQHTSLQSRLSTLDINPVSASFYTSSLATFLEQSWQSVISKWCAAAQMNTAAQIDEAEPQIITAKLQTVSEFFTAALYCPKDDLIFLPRTCERWKKVSACSSTEAVADEATISENFTKFSKLIAVANAFISKGMAFDNKLAQKIMIGAGASYYFFLRSKAMRQAEKFYARPNVEAAKTVWNLIDSKLVSPIIRFVIPRIPTNTMIFVRSGTSNFELSHLPGTIPVRLLLNQKIPHLTPTTSGMFPCASSRKLPDYNIPNLCRDIVFHIHGGGFISMSSQSHQNYTRRWALLNDVAVFSVDYRLAPESPYPDGLNDAWDAYVWVVENAERKLGIGGGRIIIAGDSAGGNLSCGVISRAIERGFRVPDGTLLAYPALNLNVQAFTNSYLYALHDLIIPHTFLKLCLNAYVQSAQHDTETDHFLSPIITPNETLAQFPPVRMMVGTHDPLHDDCWRFTERLNDAGVNVHLKVYERMMHGFLNFDLQGVGIRETHQTVMQSSDWIRELIELSLSHSV